MIPERFIPTSFSRRHLEQMQAMVGTKVKVSFRLRVIQHVLKEDAQGFYFSVKGQRISVRSDPETLNASCNLAGLVIK